MTACLAVHATCKSALFAWNHINEKGFNKKQTNGKWMTFGRL